MKKEELISDIIRHIQGHNKKLSTSFLQELSFDELMGEAHPLYREYFESEMKTLNKQQ